MPPKTKITKEMLLEQAFQIAEAQGIAAVTSRSVAKAAGCSIQPVFSHFPTMEDLRQATFQYACHRFVEEVLAFEGRPDFMPRVTKWVLDLARERPNLFRLLYLSDGFSGDSMLSMMMQFESNRRMIAAMETGCGLSRERCEDILMRSCLLLLGISTMICMNHVTITDQQAAQMMKQTVQDMISGAKEETP